LRHLRYCLPSPLDSQEVSFALGGADDLILRPLWIDKKLEDRPLHTSAAQGPSAPLQREQLCLDVQHLISQVLQVFPDLGLGQREHLRFFFGHVVFHGQHQRLKLGVKFGVAGSKTPQVLNEGEGIAAYELNVSCPNTAHGGIQFGSDPRSLEEVVSLAKRVAKRPLIVKLSPNVTSIAHMAKVAQDAGADAISLINTFVAMAIDAETRKPRIANITAGLSGPAIKPIALRMVFDAAKVVKIPVIGMGGISKAEDIAEFMLAGATAVQIGTASYWDPRATEKIVDELDHWCVEHRVPKIAELTGGLKMD